MIGQAERVVELQRLGNKEKPVGPNKIITFSSGKGGTGKSFSIINIASALARNGAKVLLIDFDTNLSNINIMLDYHPKTTSYDFLQKKRLFEETIIRYEPNLDIIFGDSGKVEYPEFNEKLAEELMKGISRVEGIYDFILIDTGSGASVGLIALLSKCDINVIVTTPEPTAVMDAYVLVKLLKVNECNNQKYVVFNKCFSFDAGLVGYNNLVTACSHFLGEAVKHLGTILYNQEVSQSIIDQKLYIDVHPKSATTSQIKILAENISKIKQVANINHAIAG